MVDVGSHSKVIRNSEGGGDASAPANNFAEGVEAGGDLRSLTVSTLQYFPAVAGWTYGWWR